MMPSMPSAAPSSTPHRIESASKPSSSSKSSSPGSSGAAAASSGVAGDGAGSRNSLKTLLTADGEGQPLAAGLRGVRGRGGGGGGRSRRRKAAWPPGTGNGGRRSEQDGSSASAEARPRRRGGGGASRPPKPLATGKTDGYMDASSAAASLYVWLGRFLGVRGRLSDSDAATDDEVADEEAADALDDASESVEDAAAECAGLGGAGGGAALTISRSGSRMPPAGMHDDAMAAAADRSVSQVDPAMEGNGKPHPQIASFFLAKPIRDFRFPAGRGGPNREGARDLGGHGRRRKRKRKRELGGEGKGNQVVPCGCAGAVLNPTRTSAKTPRRLPAENQRKGRKGKRGQNAKATGGAWNPRNFLFTTPPPACAASAACRLPGPGGRPRRRSQSAVPGAADK